MDCSVWPVEAEQEDVVRPIAMSIYSVKYYHHQKLVDILSSLRFFAAKLEYSCILLLHRCLSFCD